MTLLPTIARINELSPRARDWRRVFGSLEVELLGPAKMLAYDPSGQLREFYQVDLDKLTPDQLERVIDHVARRFGLPRSEVAETIGDHGLPIAADDVTIAFDPRHFL